MWQAIFLLLFYGNCRVNSLTDHETYLSPSGLVYIKEDDVIVTGDSWTIFMVFNATQQMLNINQLKTQFETIENKMNSSNRTIFLFEEDIKQSNIILDNLQSLNEALFDVNKRGDKNQLNDDCRPLFGAAGSHDLNRLSTIVKELEQKVDYEQIYKKIHLSITKVIEKKLTENIEKLTNLTEAIADEIEKYNYNVKQYYFYGDRVRKVQLDTEVNVTLSKNFRLFQSIGLHSLFLTNRLLNGLELAAEGRLSFSLISLKELKKELVKISSELPFGLKLASGQNSDEIYKYREISEVTAVAYDDLLMISIRVPLLSQDRGFNLYKVHSIPVKDKTSGITVRTKIDDNYFIISNDRQFYGIINYEDLNKCRGSAPKFCPATIPMCTKFVPTCISATFYKEMDYVHEHCQRTVLVTNHLPIWIPDKKNQGWIYSLVKATKVTLHCNEKQSDDIELEGTNILANVSHCSLIGQEFKLYKTNKILSNDISEANVLKPIKLELKSSIVEQLSNNEAVTKAVEDLKNEGLWMAGPGQSKEVDMKLLLSKLEANKSSSTPLSSWKTIAVPAFVALMISVAACYIILYYDKNHAVNGNYQICKRTHRKRSEEMQEDPFK